jgi:predicted  nucleic acid-binding Zn-ribbon protein
MQDLQRTLQSAGKSFEDCDAAVAEYARSLGQMETTSRTARGEISELSSAFVELSRVYGQMSEQEKASPVGQALSQSLEELKTRTVDAKSELGNLNKQLETTSTESESTGGILDKLAGKFGLTGGEALKMGSALGVATTACKVAKDAFFSNEQQLDEWGRIVASSESLYRGFLDALNTGDISGFLSRMDTIVAAARQAYDALDTLATFNAFNQINVARTRQALMDAQNDYREGTGSKEAVRSAGEAYKNELKQRRDLEKNAYTTAIVKYASERGVSSADLARVMLGTYGNYEQIKKIPLTGVSYKTVGGGMFGGGTQVETRYAANQMERLGDMLRRFNDDELKQLQALGAQTYNTGADMAQVDRQIQRTLRSNPGGTVTRSGGGGGGGGRRGGGGGGRVGSQGYVPVEGSVDYQAKKVQELQKAWRAAADDDSREKIKTQLEAAQAELEKMEGKVKAPEGSLKALNEELGKLQQEQQLVTTADDWAGYEKRIAAVQQRIKSLKGEVEELATGFAGLTNNSLGAWMGGQQASLNNAEIGSEEYQALSANILDTKTLQNLLNTALKNDITISPDTLEDLWGRIIGGENIPDEEWQQLVETINAAIADLDIKPLKIDVESGGVTQEAKQVSNSWRDAARAVGAVGSALNQLENPAAKVAGIVGQAIANIALGFAQATAKSSNLGIFGWIAAIAGGLGTMISTISAIKSATAGSYAEGGIVPGNSFSGDRLQANVNSGELILNRAQQDNVAQQLTNGIGGNLQLSAVVTGEQIRLALNNNSRRIGRGEYVTSK